MEVSHTGALDADASSPDLQAAVHHEMEACAKQASVISQHSQLIRQHLSTIDAKLRLLHPKMDLVVEPLRSSVLECDAQRELSAATSAAAGSS